MFSVLDQNEYEQFSLGLLKVITLRIIHKGQPYTVGI